MHGKTEAVRNTARSCNFFKITLRFHLISWYRIPVWLRKAFNLRIVFILNNNGLKSEIWNHWVKSRIPIPSSKKITNSFVSMVNNESS